MMAVTNKDLLRAARNRDVDMVRSCAECGAWMDYADDENGDTALHIVLKSAYKYTDYLADAERLGLTVNLEARVRCDMNSRLEPKNRAAVKKLREDIEEWNNQFLLDMELVEVLCAVGHADPGATNKANETCLDLAREADPDIKMRLEKQIRFLEELEAEEEEEE